MKLSETKIKDLVKLSPTIAEILYHPTRYHKITDKAGNSWPILEFKAGAVRAIDIGDFRFMTQNPLKDSYWGNQALLNNKITWVIHRPTNSWVIRVFNGEAVSL